MLEQESRIKIRFTLLFSICPWFPNTTPGLFSLDAPPDIPSTAPIVNRRGCLCISLGSSTVGSFVVRHGLRPPAACVAGRWASGAGSARRPVAAAVAGRTDTLSKSPVVNDGWDWRFAAAELGLTWVLPFFLPADGTLSGGMVSKASSSSASALVMYFAFNSSQSMAENRFCLRLPTNAFLTASAWHLDYNTSGYTQLIVLAPLDYRDNRHIKRCMWSRRSHDC